MLQDIRPPDFTGFSRPVAIEYSECCCGAARIELSFDAESLEFNVLKGKIAACVIPGMLLVAYYIT